MKTLSHLSVLSSSTHRFIKRERERELPQNASESAQPCQHALCSAANPSMPPWIFHFLSQETIKTCMHTPHRGQMLLEGIQTVTPLKYSGHKWIISPNTDKKKQSEQLYWLYNLLVGVGVQCIDKRTNVCVYNNNNNNIIFCANAQNNWGNTSNQCFPFFPFYFAVCGLW